MQDNGAHRGSDMSQDPNQHDHQDQDQSPGGKHVEQAHDANQSSHAGAASDSSHDTGTAAASASASAESSAQSADSAVADLTAALATAQADIAALKEDFLRAKAETENVRRRAQEDVSKTHKFAIEKFAENLLPVCDSLDAALVDQTADIAKLREGVELTLRQLTSALDKGRVIAIQPAVGDKFDPHHHQAISLVPADQEPNTVVSVLQKGFVIADRVLRPALVMVAAPK